MYFLDTCICIELMRGHLPHTYRTMLESSPKMFAVPCVVEAELFTGAEKSKNPQTARLQTERFLAPFARIPFDSACAAAYSKIRAELEQQGKKIGPNDLLIAASAVAHNATLLSGNIREFERVPGLQLENWEEVPLF